MIFNKIYKRKVPTFFACTALALVFIFCATPEKYSYAQGRFMREEWKLPDFYPRGFDGFGKIEQIEPKRVVIDDSAWDFSRQIRYATPSNRNAGRDAFNVGDTVAYLLNKDREIVSLWLIEFRQPLKK